MIFNNEKFKDDLFRIRTEKELSRKEIAQRSKVHQSTIQGIENNLYSPQIETFLKLCKWMEVKPTIYFKNN